MAVYVDNIVDNMKAAYRGMKMCHMMADTTAELLSMAEKIGVSAHYMQHPGTIREHFDICQSKRKLAIENGAKSITLPQSGLLIMLKTARNAVLRGGCTKIPKRLLVCPECGGKLEIEVLEWDEETGLPTFSGIYLNCEHEESVDHRYWQSDWMTTFDKAGRLFLASDA